MTPEFSTAKLLADAFGVLNTCRERRLPGCEMKTRTGPLPETPERGLSFAPPPSELTRFIGRAGQVEELRRLVLEERLVTLTGPGGIGKTRLALELAGGLSDQLPVAWVELAGVTHPDRLLSAVARGLGVEEDIGALGGLADHLADTGLLIVLDSCEHLVDSCAALSKDLLALMPRARILATSREALGVPGERAWLVLPLSVAAESTALEEDASESVRLFVDRARDVVPSFSLSPSNAEAVDEISKRLDGIPLALELAAARVRVLTPNQIRERLDDMFRLLAPTERRTVPRHRTLRAAMEWSHELLPEPLKVVFRRLSVFRGGFDLDAAEAVASGDGVQTGEVLEQVALLVDRSFIVVREFDGVSRYQMLEPIRQYGFGALQQAGELTMTSERHARWCLSLVDEAVPHLLTPARRMWVARLQPEFDNIRAAIRWTRTEAPELHVDLVGSIWWLWLSSQYWVEARDWLASALELPAASERAVGRARLLFGAGALDTLQGRSDSARILLEEAHELAEELGDLQLAAYALNYLGIALILQGSSEAAVPLLKGREWLEASEDLYGLRLNHLALGNHYAAKGDLDRALEVVQDGVSIARRFGTGREMAIALETLAILHVRRGEPKEAEPLLLEALEALLEDWGSVFVARALEFLALVRGRRGDLEEAGRLMGAAEVLRALVGSTPWPVEKVLIENAVQEFLASSGSTEFDAGRAEGRRAKAETLVALVVRGSQPAAVPESEALPVRVEPRRVAPEPTPTIDVPRYDIRVLALGPLEVFLGNEVIAEDQWPFSKPRELLLFLLLRREGWSREEIARALWPDSSSAQLKNSFHVALHHLRKVLKDPEWVVIERERYRLSPKRRIYFDLEDFEIRAREVLNEGSGDGASEVQLRDLLSLYRGEFGQDQTSARWCDEPADSARALRRQLGVRLGDVLERQRRDREAAEIYRTLAAQDELHEEIQRRFMLALARSGERTLAIKHYERLREILARELDAEPEEATRLLWEQIREGAVAAVSGS